MKKKLVAALVLLMALALMGAALAEGQTALDAFNALLAEDEGAMNAIRTADAWLDEVMAGEYAGSTSDPAEAEVLAEKLEPLSSITDKDLAAYASTHDLKVAQVRNAYYKALANVLSAEILAHPAAEEKYRNIQLILSLFLEPEAGEAEASSKAEVRAKMSPEYSRKLADESALPVQFVEFVIMDEDWRDESWENDGDWRSDARWEALSTEYFEDIPIGSRDSGDSTRIADMQELLISLGYLRGKADGVFGPRTQAALMEFQLANGMKATGAYAAADYERLLSSEAVARWDYDDDFWDSDDFDPYRSPDIDADTPDPEDGTVEGMDTPDTPEKVEKKKDTPDTPEKVSKKKDTDTPDTPDSPEEKGSKKSSQKSTKKSSKESSKKKDSPDTPD